MPTAKISARLSNSAPPAADRLEHREAAEHVGLAQAQQEPGSGKGGDGQHQAAAQPLQAGQIQSLLGGAW
jgi:hypothetical protein